MTACTACGHGPLAGRYCSNCGVPAARGVTPEPTPLGTPPPARFPLYVDEVTPPASAPSTEPPTLTGPPLPPPGSPATGPEHDNAGRDEQGAAPRRALPTPWLAGIAVVVGFAVLGAALLFLGGASDDATVTADRTTPVETPSAGEQDGEPAPPALPAEISRLAPTDITVPGVAPASQDNDGNRVTYDAANLFDEDPRTTWRVPGDASGAVLTFRFDDPVTVTDIGLINGYAKEDPPNDWYAANRRVLGVEWTFGDGTTVGQDLTEEREVQRMEIEPVETDVVELRLTEVSAPRSRDHTAISEISLSGSAG